MCSWIQTTKSTTSSNGLRADLRRCGRRSAARSPSPLGIRRQQAARSCRSCQARRWYRRSCKGLGPNSRKRTLGGAELLHGMLRVAPGQRSAGKRPLQSLGGWQSGGDPMLHERWQEQTFAARAAANHHRTNGMRTNQTLDFRLSLTQHGLASAAGFLLRCSACRRSSRSPSPTNPEPKPHFCCWRRGPSRRRQNGLVQMWILLTRHSFVLAAQVTQYCLLERCPTPFKFSEQTIYLMWKKDRGTGPGHACLRVQIVGAYRENEGVGG
ncbi:hypothetical protein PhaeoP83_01000 [Phaeobacter inhibens]|uniref:Uncharacterized protein n=1 Tax=Phaeobacter inhibens TaxID=221822 RepID=A0ABM6RBM5_9RHOB|nr:hypothetical protein PhaeoP83_01000 [Phaeobacter inhibens]AUQ93797.1 hypothetical protein PhaeoP66_00993 [Phaeobacter inhibens]AUR19100.1 hypothetical protein PhaeoP80_01000 [Phaeobacter inhibens]